MKSQKMKSHLKNYYSDQSLSNEKLQQLMVLSDNVAERILPDSTSIKEKVSAWCQAFFLEQRAVLMVSVLFVFMSFWGISNYEQNKFLRNNFTEVVAQEIALNHRKQLSLDFNVSEYSNLAQLMSKLDFQMKKSNDVNLTGLNVVGARYCSIQGNIAAQIRLRSDDGKIFTLYQTRLTDSLKKNPANNQIVDQVEVRQWQENGLFFGLAVTVDPSS